MDMSSFNGRFDPMAYQGALGGPAPFAPFGSGGQPARPRGALSGFLDPAIALPIAAALAGAPNFQQSIGGGLAAAGQGAQALKQQRLVDTQKQAVNDWLKAGSPRDPNHPAMRALLDASPELAQKYALQQMAPTGQDLTAEQKNYNAGLKNPDFKSYQEHMRPGLDEGSPLNVRRWTLSANAAVKPYTELSAYKLVQNAAPYLSRIEAVSGSPGSISDQELLDSVVKLNTGGNQVTEAQVALALKGQSLADKVSTWTNYMAANGGVLSDDQRKQLQDVAHAVYRGYQKMYKPVYDAAQKALKSRGIPESYWSAIPDLNSLSQAAGIDPATGDPGAAASADGAPAAPAQGGVVPYTEYFK